ncbi:Ig kappa chain V19-17-like [Clarias magur]|uniref:Ig kappa chain V19-17-like n=1 Tax=Clarias magur TaxID=1594786 RepID=A0A8J4XBA6_CLAMG|nr:Ig kappa chain V19-17-like [Clarias magur]
MVQVKALPVFLCVMGLYYCSYMKKSEIIFRNSTSLQLKVVNVTIPEDKPTGSDCPAVCFMLTAGEFVHYIPQEFSKIKIRRAWRRNENVYTHVIYFSVAQSKEHT